MNKVWVKNHIEDDYKQRILLGDGYCVSYNDEELYFQGEELCAVKWKYIVNDDQYDFEKWAKSVRLIHVGDDTPIQFSHWISEGIFVDAKGTSHARNLNWVAAGITPEEALQHARFLFPWAQYIAMDSNGYWYLYSDKPERMSSSWQGDAKSTNIGKLNCDCEWTTSLRRAR